MALFIRKAHKCTNLTYRDTHRWRSWEVTEQNPCQTLLRALPSLNLLDQTAPLAKQSESTYTQHVCAIIYKWCYSLPYILHTITQLKNPNNKGKCKFSWFVHTAQVFLCEFLGPRLHFGNHWCELTVTSHSPNDPCTTLGPHCHVWMELAGCTQRMEYTPGNNVLESALTRTSQGTQLGILRDRVKPRDEIAGKEQHPHGHLSRDSAAAPGALLSAPSTAQVPGRDTVVPT